MSDPELDGASGADIAHGGNLDAARRLFPGAPEPLIDLSTGINPHAYPVPPLPPETFTRLPEPTAVAALESVAAKRYGAPSAAHVVAAPGTQILLPLIASMLQPGVARVLAPTYAEHARAARLAGHECADVADVAALDGARLAVVVNPNNPDGRMVPRDALLAVRAELLVVDEAFGEVTEGAGARMAAWDSCPAMALGTLAGDVRPGLVVLRSFGKFHGLAGVRLGFAIAAPETTAWLRARLGPWAVSGPAVAIGTAALRDRAWAAAMRRRLATDCARLDALLAAADLTVCGGTSLFRLVRGPLALFDSLGQAGIVVRRFVDRPGLFRLGVPPDDAAWTRLTVALPPLRGAS